jgi:collagenase-like PrtC family protease
MTRLALTLGPLFFLWPAEKLRNFYFRIADEAPVDRVHVGEVVCVKRMPFSDPVWPEIIERLEHGGKQVMLSTLAAPATVRERKAIAELCIDERLVEINDITALPARRASPSSPAHSSTSTTRRRRASSHVMAPPASARQWSCRWRR